MKNINLINHHRTITLLHSLLLPVLRTNSKKEYSPFNWTQKDYLSALAGDIKHTGIAH